MTIIFDEGYDEFIKWCELYPGGYCINTGKTKESAYAFLHTAQCKHLIGYEANDIPSGGYRIKICSLSIDDLFTWCLENPPRISGGFHKLCKDCITDHDQVWQSLQDKAGQFLLSPVALDVEAPKLPRREAIQTSRIVRDTRITSRVKRVHDCRCQLCGESLRLADGRMYAEAHHIPPLSEDGPDVVGNVICVCPNHHALLDYAAIPLDLATLRLHDEHKIESKYISYHNEKHETASKPSQVQAKSIA